MAGASGKVELLSYYHDGEALRLAPYLYALLVLATTYSKRFGQYLNHLSVERWVAACRVNHNLVQRLLGLLDVILQ